MATAKRITKKDNFAALAELVDRAHVEGLVTDAGANQLAGFIKHEVELLEKKHNAKGGNTKRNAAQAAVKSEIVAILTDADAPMRATDIHKAGAGTSVQQVTALVKQLVEGGEVTRTEDKGKAFFSVG